MIDMVDKMSNGVAVITLKHIKYNIEKARETDDSIDIFGCDRKALDMAIKALESQSCDCVSRKDVIILIDEATELHPYKVIGDSETYSNYNQGWEDACNWLYANVESDNLKTVTPSRPKGKWIDSNLPQEKYVCSECGGACWYYDYEGSVAKSKYCPNCGTDMRESEDNACKGCYYNDGDVHAECVVCDKAISEDEE